MDMVNDGKDIRLDTPQAVKEALASGKDLYNPETGEFWWEYNYTGSIANTYVHLDDPNLLAVIDNPDFDLYEDIVGGLNYTGYITDSPDYYAENADDYPDAPDYDERDAVFAQIASEDGWVIASPENVRAAVQSHMAEHGGEAPGKENDMDKAAEIAAWKENHVPIDRNGDDALVMHKMTDGSREFIASLVQYGFLDQVYSRIKNELRYLPDMNELRMVVSAADSLSRHYIEMGSNPVTEEEALEFIEDCSKYPSYVIPGLDMPWEEYGPFGKVANDGRALEIINTLKRSSLATSLDDHPQGVSLKQAAMEAREASAKLFDKNVGADSPTRRDER